MEDDVGDADLAEVVQARGHLQLVDPLGREAHPHRQRVAELDDLLGVATGVAVAQGEQLGQRADAGVDHLGDDRRAAGVLPAERRERGEVAERGLQVGVVRRGDRERRVAPPARAHGRLRGDVEALDIGVGADEAPLVGSVRARGGDDLQRVIVVLLAGDQDRGAAHARQPARLVDDQRNSPAQAIINRAGRATPGVQHRRQSLARHELPPCLLTAVPGVSSDSPTTEGPSSSRCIARRNGVDAQLLPQTAHAGSRSTGSQVVSKVWMLNNIARPSVAAGRPRSACITSSERSVPTVPAAGPSVIAKAEFRWRNATTSS